MFESLAVPALLIFVATSLVLALDLDWRASISALGIQYVGVIILVGITWPVDMAVVKLVAGWIAAAVLGMEMVSIPGDLQDKESPRLSGVLFRILLGILVGFALYSLAPEVTRWMLQASYEQVLGGIFLMGMGIFHLGLSEKPFRIAIGILTFLSGFEIIYATLESSPLVAGFLTLLTLGVALISTYLIAAPRLEAQE